MFIFAVTNITHSMNRLLSILFSLFVLGIGVTSCVEENSYAELIKKQRKQINSFLSTGMIAYTAEGDTLLYVPKDIKVISESEFLANDTTTDVSKNEYVLFGNSGVYMQIIRKGVGEKLAENTSATLLARFVEYNIATDTISLSNRNISMAPDELICTNTYGTITGQLLKGVLLASLNGSATSVPTGWLKPLEYIRIGRAIHSEDQIAKVRLIVPSTSGHGRASNGNYACFYEITFQKARS